MKRLYVVATEPSGDLLGGYLIKTLRDHDPSLEIKGIGGVNMDIPSLFPMKDLSVMGIVEVIPHLPRLYKRFKQTIEDIESFQPHALVTIDGPSFSARLIKALKKRNFKTKYIHYVAPTVWAWKPKRALIWSELVDELMCLFPFEPSYFTAHGGKATFVGHPLIEEKIIPSPVRNRLLILPGSRKQEVKRHAEIFIETASYFKDLKPTILTLPHLAHLYEGFKKVEIISNPALKKQVLSESAGAIAASGTVTLELAIANIPMVVAYRLSPLSYRIAKRLVKIRYTSLINLLANAPLVSECLQKECHPKVLRSSLEDILSNPPSYEDSLGKLHPKESPSLKAAQIIFKNLK